MPPPKRPPARSLRCRTFTLSKELDADRIGAEMNQGVLRITLPKVAQAQPRRIQVQVA